MQVPGFTHPVTDVYLDDILPLIGHQVQGKFKEAAQPGSGEPQLSSEDQAALDDAIFGSFVDASQSSFDNLLRVCTCSKLSICMVLGFSTQHILHSYPERILNIKLQDAKPSLRTDQPA